MDSNGIKKQVGETCIVCEEEKALGIHLYTSFICVECEKSLINTETSDPMYQYFLRKLQRVKTPPLYS
ncbi:sigma factor G inhibitor Gin [Metabacillus herbersteinensis]|uniref:Sigma factor G inhibitor Gin n=1 Tax=Metabacillus herbersteinensis TaxID=283816 RepID=A0ABV6GL34_9BACI